WQKGYNYGYDDNGYSVAVDDTGNIFVEGYSSNGSNYDYCTIKYDSNGNTLWLKRYNSGNEDYGFGLAVDPSGNIYVSGHSHNDSNYDYFAIKYDTNGNTVWQKRYNSGGTDNCWSIGVDPLGNAYVTGSSNSDYFTIKYDTNGNTVWQKSWNGGSTDEAWAIAVDASGNVYAAGHSVNANDDYLTIKYDTNGNTLWQKRYNGGGNDYIKGIAVDSNGNVYVGGYSSNGLNYDYLTIKYDTNGNTLWQKRFNGGNNDYAQATAVDTFGNVYITGGFQNGANWDLLTVKYDTNGNTLWQKIYCGVGDDWGLGITVDAGKNVYVTGFSSNGLNNDCLLIKYSQIPDTSPASILKLTSVPFSIYINDPSPAITIEAQNSSGTKDGSFNGTVTLATNSAGGRFSLSVTGWSDVNQVTLTAGTGSVYYKDSNFGNPFISVCRSGFFSDMQVETVRIADFSESPPSIAWQRYYNGGGHDNGYGIAVDTSGNVYMAGYSMNGPYYDYVSIKYDTDGNTVWLKKYNSGGDDYSWSISVDPSGNAYVTGRSNSDYLTIKYDSNGNTLWQKRYDGGDNDEAWSIAVDSGGSVYVAGHTKDINCNYLTIKYDTDGNTLWQRRYDGGGNDYSKGIAVDTNGNVYVTGYSSNGINSDYLTIKYDTNGNVIWIKSRDLGSNDYAQAIAVDVSGNVYVTGESNNGINWDGFTVKYNLVGDIAWENRFNGGYDDSGFGITVDPSKNVYVTGFSSNGSNNDYITIKYLQVSDTSPASKLKVVSSPFNIPVNTVSSAITIEAQNNSGIKDVSFNNTVSLITTSGGGKFSLSATSWADVNFITLAAGAGTVYYKDSNSGNPLISVSRIGLSSDNQVETITSVVDNVPPVTSISIGNPKSVIGGETYVSLLTPFVLSVVDTGSGVASTKYRINNDSWKTYSGPFTFTGEGVSSETQAHLIYYYSVDNSGNTESVVAVPGLDPGVVALWHMDEVSGSSVADASSEANNGIATGTSITAGISVRARQFSTLSDYVVVPNDPSLQSSGSMTIEAWIYPTSFTSSEAKIVDKGDDSLSSNNEYQFFLESSGRVYFIMHHGSSFNQCFSTAAVSLNQWNHVAAVYNKAAGMMCLYINGVPDDTENNTYGANVLNYNVWIGRDEHYSSRRFSGIIDEVRISNTARSETEIRDAAAGEPRSVSVKLMHVVSETQSYAAAIPGTIIADGADSSRVSIHILNSAGQPLSGRIATIWTQRGPSYDDAAQPSATDANGMCTGFVSSSYAGTAVIMVSCEDKIFAGPVVTFVPVYFRFTTPAREIERTFASDTMTVEVQDETGTKMVQANYGALIASSSAAGKFSLDKVNWSAFNTMTLTLASGSASLYYKDSVCGNPVLTVSFGILADSQTENVTDTIAPLPPSGLSPALVSQNRVQLDWQISVSDDAAGYYVFWDSATGIIDYASPCTFTQHPLTAWTSGSLLEGVQYKFGVRARDITGNTENNTGMVAAITVPVDTSVIRAVIKVPQAGKKVSGNRLTVIAELINGSPWQVDNILFEYKPSADTAWISIPAANSNHPNPDRMFPYFVQWNVDLLPDGSYDIRAAATDVYGRTDSAPMYITIIVDQVDPDINEGENAGGDHEKKEKVDPALNNCVKVGNDEGNNVTAITIPGEALSGPTRISVTILSPSGAPPQQNSLVPADEFREFKLENGQTQLLGNTCAVVSMQYNDEDCDGFIDGTGVSEDRLCAYYFSTSGWPHWEKVATVVDKATKTCTFTTPHFSIFGLFGVASADLKTVKVYPNPCKSGSGGIYDAGKITFVNLTANATIRIYNLAGELVWEKANVSLSATWDLKNTSSAGVASGVYIYLIIDNLAGEKLAGKVAVIR
ncbi:hypothetical protein COY52_12445, partial [Candidatus Desantisbacteria bacterium CG_4_10_14_0_8_um_filter_48_22]